MKEWEELSDEEHDYVWLNIKECFQFTPKYSSLKNDLSFLKLPKPFHIYDMHLFESYLKDKSILISEEYYSVFNNYIKNILMKCMGYEDYLYALVWHHSCFRYNPKSEEKMPHILETEDYNIYFPDFYPDGDYHFFIAKDFSWGYFTHPWTQQLWVFGKEMTEEIKKIPSRYLTLRV
jgi:hypothetical protein